MKTNDDGKFCMHVLDSHDIIFKIQSYGNYLIGIYLNWNWN